MPAEATAGSTAIGWRARPKSMPSAATARGLIVSQREPCGRKPRMNTNGHGCRGEIRTPPEKPASPNGSRDRSVRKRLVRSGYRCSSVSIRGSNASFRLSVRRRRVDPRGGVCRPLPRHPPQRRLRPPAHGFQDPLSCGERLIFRPVFQVRPQLARRPPHPHPTRRRHAPATALTPIPSRLLRLLPLTFVPTARISAAADAIPPAPARSAAR